MRPVRVQLIEKQRLDNHRPEFRPTDNDKLYGAERTVATAFNKITAAIPGSLLVDLVFDRINAASVLQRITDLLEDDPTLLERPLFHAFQVGQADAAEQQRAAVNQQLRKFGVNVRLRSTSELRKAVDQVLWQPELSSFNMTDPNAPARVYARIRSNEILTYVSGDVRESVARVVADSFRVSQQFSTGRVVTGLTPQQTAQSLFYVLDAASPVTPTGADLAARVVPHARGLTPRMAAAVQRHGTEVAYRQIRNGASEQAALRAAERSMERYGNRARRSRARTIARTEIQYAQNAGLQAQHETMIASGVVSPDSEKEWVTGPFDVCDICVPLGGTRVPVPAEFFWPSGSGNPPAHPSCRCKTRLVPTLSGPPRRIGSNTPDDPYRYVFEDGWTAPLAN